MGWGRAWERMEWWRRVWRILEREHFNWAWWWVHRRGNQDSVRQNRRTLWFIRMEPRAESLGFFFWVEWNYWNNLKMRNWIIEINLYVKWKWNYWNNFRKWNLNLIFKNRFSFSNLIIEIIFEFRFSFLKLKIKFEFKIWNPFLIIEIIWPYIIVW
jgi:hypothetical protein